MAKIPKNASDKKSDGKEEVRLLPVEIAIHGFNKKDSELYSQVNLKYYDYLHECFSAWSQDELSDFSKFSNKLTKMTWRDIYRSAGSRGNKQGLGYTVHKNKKKLPKDGNIQGLSEDITLFELKINEKSRVHGFRSKGTFFLVWLDRNHQIYKM